MFENTLQGPGAGTYTNHTIEILLMLFIALLLGLLLGYILWYRWRKLHLELQSEYDSLRSSHTDLEKDHVSVKYQLSQAEKEAHESKSRLRSLEADMTLLKMRLEKSGGGGSEPMAAGISVRGAVATPPPQPDDLKIIEGVGPKIEKLLNESNIWTYAQLAASSVEVLQKILDDAGPRYRIADPGTWAKQASLANEGKWDELNEYQDLLKGGRPPE